MTVLALALLLALHAPHGQEAPAAAGGEAAGEDWPGFLGPRRDGTSRETGLALDWPPEGPPLLWEVERGSGYASPAVAGGLLVVTHRLGDRAVIDALEPETGALVWRHEYPCHYRGRYISDGGPRATPEIDDGRVFVHGVEGVLHCLELATGRVLWKRDLHEEYGLADNFFGVVSSPLVVGDLLVVNVGVPGPTVVAFDKRTGEVAWEAEDAWGASCASPILASPGGRERLFVQTGGDSRPPTGGLLVLDPETGAIEHRYPFRSKTYESVNGATPAVAGRRVFLTAAYGTGTAALEVDGEGRWKELWATRHVGVEFSTPLVVDGRLYLLDGVHGRAGALVALDPDTGEELARTDLAWDETVVDRGEEKRLSFGVGAGSLLWVEGRFLVLGDGGHLLSVRPGPEGATVLRRATLFHATESWTPPVLSHGLLYVCQNNRERYGADPRPRRLLCYDLRPGPRPGTKDR